LLKNGVGAKTFGCELLGWSVHAEIVQFQPDTIPNSEAKVLLFPIRVTLICLLCLLDGQLTARLYLMDMVESFREAQGLLVRGAIGVDRVVAIVRIERGHTNRRVEMVVVSKFSGM